LGIGVKVIVKPCDLPTPRRVTGATGRGGGSAKGRSTVPSPVGMAAMGDNGEPWGCAWYAGDALGAGAWGKSTACLG